jgi:hypothetical protein
LNTHDAECVLIIAPVGDAVAIATLLDKEFVTRVEGLENHRGPLNAAGLGLVFRPTFRAYARATV